MKNNNKELALITGASSGIGFECARILAEQGYDLIIVARRKDKLDALKRELEEAHDISVHTVAMDLSEPKGPYDLYSHVQKTGKHISVLINNAGFGQVVDFMHMESDAMESMIQLNITTPTILCRLFGHEMTKHKNGYILNVSSIGAFQPSPHFAVYSATKAYLLSFGEAIHLEMKPLGVKVTNLYPGNTATEFMDVAHVKKSFITKGAMTSRQVAQMGINAMFKGRRSIVSGLINKANVMLMRSLPRAWSSRLAGTLGRMLKK